MDLKNILLIIGLILSELYIFILLPTVGIFHLNLLGYTHRSLVSPNDFLVSNGYNPCPKPNFHVVTNNETNVNNEVIDLDLTDFDNNFCIGVVEIDTFYNPVRLLAPHRMFTIWDNDGHVIYTTSLYAKSFNMFLSSVYSPVEGVVKSPDSFFIKALNNDKNAKLRVVKSRSVQLNLDDLDDLNLKFNSNMNLTYSMTGFYNYLGHNCWSYSNILYEKIENMNIL